MVTCATDEDGGATPQPSALEATAAGCPRFQTSGRTDASEHSLAAIGRGLYACDSSDENLDLSLVSSRFQQLALLCHDVTCHGLGARETCWLSPAGRRPRSGGPTAIGPHSDRAMRAPVDARWALS